ncbi:MAG: FtsX-like permease family protein [Chlamydiota bacterium]
MQLIFFAFRNLFRNFRRTLTIVLTIAVGSGALFCFDGFIKGIQRDFKESTIHSQSGNGEFHTLGYRQEAYTEPWKHWIEDYPDLAEFLYAQEGVDFVFPRVSISGMLTHEKQSITGVGQGIHAEEEADFFESLDIVEGEPLVDQENGILLGKGLAKAIGAHPGSRVRFYTKSLSGKMRQRDLDVIGLFETGNAEFDNHMFRMQIGTAQSLLGTHLIESVSVGLKDHAYWSQLSENIEELFPHLEGASFAELNKIWYQHSMDWLSAQYFVVEIIILSIVLLGIFNTISSSILERKQEIGNLRANGESVPSVLRLIAYEGLFLGLFGGLLGILTAYLFAKGILYQGILMPPGPGQTKQFLITFLFQEKMAVQALVLSMASALVGSVFAGIKVCKMSIAEQLRAL